MLGNLGFSEIMIILLVVLVVFGAKRMPEIGASFGKGIREFKRSISGVSDEVANVSDSNQSPRQIDAAAAAPQQPAATGEPKRLSQ